MIPPDAKPSFPPKLNSSQLDAVNHGLGPVLVIAGAGTGKTTVLTQRIVRLVREGVARPEEILAVTYTRNATREMRERIVRELGDDAGELRPHTFHEYCYEILRRRSQTFAVLEESDLWIFLKRRIRELKLEHYIRATDTAAFLSALLKFIQRCEDELITPEQYREYVGQVEREELPLPRVVGSGKNTELDREAVLARCHELARVFETVQRWLLDANLGTYSQIIAKCLHLLEQDAGLLVEERLRTRFILADEFQDANRAQIRLLALLAGAERNIFAVGDPDQAIYEFRGASSEAFQMFEERFPDSRVIHLQENQRSTSAILRSAYAVIGKNPALAVGSGDGSFARSLLVSGRQVRAKAEGAEISVDPVEVAIYADTSQEAADVAVSIRDLRRRSGCCLKEFAILYRSHGHRDLIIQELVACGIPFRVDRLDIRDTPEIRDLVACLRAVVFPGDSMSLFRVAALPCFQVDPQVLQRAVAAAPRDTALATVLATVPGGGEVLQTVVEARQRAILSGSDAVRGLAILLEVFHLNGHRNGHRKGKLVGGIEDAVPVVRCFRAFVADWQTRPIVREGTLADLADYLEEFAAANGRIALAEEADTDAVQLMTVHGAKGLEFKHVYVIRAVSGSFPSNFRESVIEFPPQLSPPLRSEAGTAALNSAVSPRERHNEEERRLFYVAMTRAKDKLTLYGKKGRGKNDPTPPGYLRELLTSGPLPASVLRERGLRVPVVDLRAEAAEVEAVGVARWVTLPLPLAEPLRLSASAIVGYERCPLQFKISRQWGLPEDAAAAMQYGACVHRVLQKYYEASAAEHPYVLEDLLRTFDDELQAAGIEDAYQRTLLQQQGRAHLSAYYESVLAEPQRELLRTESTFNFTVDDVSVRGRIDRVDSLGENRVALVDYKTGHPQKQEDADESLQLTLYALAMEREGKHAARLEFHNLEDSTVIVTERRAESLREAEDRVRNVAASIRAGNFKATPGIMVCPRCAYRSICPTQEKSFVAVGEMGGAEE